MPQVDSTLTSTKSSSLATPNPQAGFGAALMIAAWFGIFTGILEGLGLLMFQRLNWASWGPMLHVSPPIIWISAIVDLLFFAVLATVAFLLSRLIPWVTRAQAVVFLLTFSTMYDWLTLTGRLYHKSSLLLALGVAVVFSRWFKKNSPRVVTFWRKSLPSLCVILIFTFVAVTGGERWREQRELAKLPSAMDGDPNVILIVVDTLRADHLSGYGYARATSPTLDRLAREGALFENAISTSSWSLPSHASLVTGRYVHEHGEDNVKPIRLFGANTNNFGNLPTIGERLEARGYRTGAFSANRTWFSHDLGFGRGFIHFEDYFNSPADMLVRTLYGREFARIYLSRTDHSKPKRFLRWIGWDSLLDPDEEGSGSRGGALGVRKRASAVNDELTRWIGRESSHPFFAFINYFDVHKQYGGPRGFTKPDWPQQTPLDAYDDSIRYVDDNIAQLMATLRDRGLDKNTLLIVTSDHGESLGEHGLETHGGSLYWNLIHVPLILWWPGHVPANVRINEPVSNMVIPATVISLSEHPPADSFRGPALDAYWSSQPAPGPVLSELAVSPYASKKDRPTNQVPTAVTGPMKTIVSGNWQLIEHAKYGYQLFDWQRDPVEAKNLAETPEGDGLAESLRAQLQQELARGSR